MYVRGLWPSVSHRPGEGWSTPPDAARVLSTARRCARPGPRQGRDPVGVERIRRRQLASELAEHQDGVASRSQLAALGISRHEVRSEVDGGRWRRHGRQTISVHTGPLTTLARCWAAIFETGTAIAAIDGVTSLQHAGLTGYVDDSLHVSAVHNHNTERLPGVRIHKVIRRVAGELIETGLPRTRPEVAAIRAAHWATSDRQAALILLMTVQQRLTTPMRLAAAQRLVRGRTRRAFIRAVVRDIAFGVQSLGELDFARLCRPAVCRALPAGGATDPGWAHLPRCRVGRVRPRRRDRRGAAPCGARRHEATTFARTTSCWRETACCASTSSGCVWRPTASWTRWPADLRAPRRLSPCPLAPSPGRCICAGSGPR